MMVEVIENANELKTVSVGKDTWILELPAELCQREGARVPSASRDPKL